MFGMKCLALSASLILANSYGAMAAQPPNRGPTPGLGWGPGGRAIAVPGPVAGLGIPVLLAAGGYIWFVSRRRAKRDRDSS